MEPRCAARAGVDGRMAVTRLVLTDYRCYARLRLEVDARPVVLTGPNGAGKTNLLEALSFLAPGRGLRGAPLAAIDRLRAGVRVGCGWTVAARLATPAGSAEVGTGHERPQDGDGAGARDGRRVVRIDGAPVRGQAALARTVRLGWVTPEMDRLFSDRAAGRRRFLDRMVSDFDPDHVHRLAVYDHAMRERARLLRERAPDYDARWCAALEDRMAREGVAIAAARRATTARLGDAAGLGIGPFPKAALAMTGSLDDWLDTMPALAAEDRLREALAADRPRDADSGGAATGPHRSELAARHLDRDMPAAQCSTGEQKALLLSIVLAHARLSRLEHGAPPVLLLDEVAAHLDAAHRDALFEELLALGAQVWLTGTDAALFASLRGCAQFYGVADAALTPLATADPGTWPRRASA